MNSKLKNVIESITSIVDGKGKTCKYEIINYSSKYSNTKKAIYKLKINGKIISRSNSYIVNYDCFMCDKPNAISANGFTKKLNNDIVQCRTCKEYDITKKEKQIAFMKKNNPQFRCYKKSTRNEASNADKISKSNMMFEQMDNEFVSRYYAKHMTVNEFSLVSSKIISIGNKNISFDDKLAYYPHIVCNNQTKFTPMLYNEQKDIMIKPEYIEWKCDKCSTSFTNRDLYIQKGRHKIMCKDCNFLQQNFQSQTLC